MIISGVGGDSLNKIRIRKNLLIPIIAIIIFLILVIPTSAVIAVNIKTPTETKTLSILMNDVNGQDYSIKKDITEEEFNELNVSVSNLLTLSKNTINDNSPGGKNITIVEWDNIQNAIIKIIDIINIVIGTGFPYAITIAFILSLINLLHGPLYIIRQPILSFGLGICWVPFYDYETLIGKIIRPIFIRHLIGFSVTARLNPFRLGVPYWDFGLHRIYTFLFRGILINFADLGINKVVEPQLLIGYGVFTGLFQW